MIHTILNNQSELYQYIIIIINWWTAVVVIGYKCWPSKINNEQGNFESIWIEEEILRKQSMCLNKIRVKWKEHGWETYDEKEGDERLKNLFYLVRRRHVWKQYPITQNMKNWPKSNYIALEVRRRKTHTNKIYVM